MNAHVTSRCLLRLQSELRSMSDALEELYQTLWGDLNALGQEWADEKMDEFNEEFKNSRETILQLSEKYRHWADSYLPRRIETAIRYERESPAI